MSLKQRMTNSLNKTKNDLEYWLNIETIPILFQKQLSRVTTNFT